MADIINLRLARKARTRADKERQADANRAKFGQTKVQRQAQRREEERADRQLQGKKREATEDCPE